MAMLAAVSAVASVAAVAAVGPAASAQAASAGWSRPVRLASPVRSDVLPALVAFSARGTASIGFSVEDVDAPAFSTGYVVQRAPNGKLTRPRALAGAQRLLSLAYDGGSGELLTGTSPAGFACCSSAQALSVDGGRARTLVDDQLAGASDGRLLGLGRRWLAAMASERGVWVAQSSPGAPFGATTRLSDAAADVVAFDAASVGGGETAVAWAASDDGSSPPQFRDIFVARGSAKSPPRRASLVITAAPGHAIDELEVAAGPGERPRPPRPAPGKPPAKPRASTLSPVPTLVWVESWTDPRGRFRSQVRYADLGRTVRAHALSSASELAAGLSVASDASGEEAVSWKACTSAGSCSVRAALRGARGGFSAVARLGSIDPPETPAVSVSPSGQALLGWIASGHVFAAAASRGARGLGAVRLVSRTNYATDLTIAFGPAGKALAVWTQGTLAQAVMGAEYSSG
ncbi:MAG: hypothetical protein JO153_05130 [Solirubrobacterales bacterium]|nr:hypothetical protein [Solirubrobacterales bacterium]